MVFVDESDATTAADLRVFTNGNSGMHWRLVQRLQDAHQYASMHTRNSCMLVLVLDEFVYYSVGCAIPFDGLVNSQFRNLAAIVVVRQQIEFCPGATATLSAILEQHRVFR